MRLVHDPIQRLVAAIEYRLWVEPDEFALHRGQSIDRSRPFHRTYRLPWFDEHIPEATRTPGGEATPAATEQAA